MKTIKLNNGVEMPLLGLGTFKMTEKGEAYHAVVEALKAGYRHIDTAMVYENEIEVGAAIRDSGLEREDLFITTKLSGAKLGYDSAKVEFQKSLDNLGLTYIDLYLIHWPNYDEINIETWKALEELYKEGKVRALGLSNFQVHHIEALLETCEIKPVVNQVECHPGIQQKLLKRFCDTYEIKVIAHTPLMRGEVYQKEELHSLAKKYNKTVANITCRWLLQRGIIIIPKSSKKERIIANMDVFDFTLSDKEMESFEQYANGRLFTMDPNNTKHYK